MKFNVKVIRCDEYEIEIDETLFNAEWLAEFRKHFYDFENTEEVAEFLAKFQARFGSDQINIEGFGNVCRNRTIDRRFFLNTKQPPKPTPGLNIRIINEDNDIDCVTEVVTEEKK